MATNFWELLQQHQGDLTKSGRTVADYLVQHAAEAQYLSISSLAKECCVAEATVFRFCRALGFEGYHEMRIALAQANATGALVNQHVPEPDADTATLCEHASALLMTTINGTLQMAFCWNIAQQANSDNNAAGLTNDGDEIFPMAFPTDSGDPKLCGGIWGFGIFDNGDEAKIEAARTFIDFIAADPDQVKDSVLASTYFPVRTSVGDIYADNEIMSEYSKFMAYLGDYYQITPGWATARTEWWNMLQRVGSGEDVETAVKTFVDNANAAAQA